MRRLDDDKHLSDDEEDEPPLPHGFHKYQKTWVTEADRVKWHRATLLGTLIPNETVVVQWDGWHKPATGTEQERGTVNEVIYERI